MECSLRGAKLGCVAQGGGTVIPFEFEDAAFHPTEPLLFLRKPGATWRVHDAATGKLQHPGEDHRDMAGDAQVTIRSEKAAIPSGAFSVGGRTGLLGASGEILIPPVFDALGTGSHHPFLALSAGQEPILMPARIGKLHGAVSASGKIVIPAEYDQIVQHSPWSLLLFARKGDRWQIFRGVSGELALPDRFDSVETSAPADGVFRAVLEGLEGRIDARTLQVVIPFRYKKLGFEAYSGEVGWSRDSRIFSGMIGVLCDNEKWGILGENEAMVAPCEHERVLFNGHFFSGNINPVAGMAECRKDAAARQVKIVAFTVSGGRANGYVGEDRQLRRLP